MRLTRQIQLDHLRPIVDAIGDGVHCHWIASNEITAEVDLLQPIQLCIKRGNLQFTNVNVTKADGQIKDKMRFHRSRSVGACNSHTKPMSRHFYRLTYF